MYNKVEFFYLDVYTCRDLDVFITEHVQPDQSYLEAGRASVDRVVTILQHNVPDSIRPSSVIKVP